MEQTRFYEFRDFRLDVIERVLWKGNDLVVLPQKVFETLLVLVSSGGRIVDREDFMQKVWADTFVEEGNLSVNISILRKTLGKDFIETVPRRGYRFVAEVRTIAEPGQPLIPNLSGSPSISKARTTSKTAVIITATVLTLLIGIGLYFFSSFSPHRTVSRVKSIAVIPFQNGSGGESEYLSDGLTQSLTNSLSELADLKVIAQSSASRYKGNQVSPQEIGRVLKVEDLLYGILNQHGDNLSLDLELVDPSDGRQIWGKRYTTKLSEMVSLQSQITRDVCEQLHLGPGKTNKRYTNNPEAYRLYLKGKYFCGQWTKDGFSKGTDYFSQALALDPNFALAYDGLAYCYYATGFWLPWKQSTAKARDLTNRALQLDPNLAEAHTSMAIILTWGYYDWANAEKEFKQALKLNPNYAPAHLWYGFLLLPLERVDESIAETKRAVELDPLSPDANSGLGVYLFYAGRYDEARQQLKSTIELEPAHWFSKMYLARVNIETGDVTAGIAELEETKQLNGASAEVWAALGYAYAISGKPQQARKMLEQLTKQAEQSYVSPYNFATIYAGLGEKDNAFRFLEKEYIEGTYYLNYLQFDPQLKNLRFDPRYAALVQRMGFPVRR
jgi:TolB-like protein/DNA-binding winged helix-turn-helix (wHTH) protein/Tfp pilus assembly protein PilF